MSSGTSGLARSRLTFYPLPRTLPSPRLRSGLHFLSRIQTRAMPPPGEGHAGTEREETAAVEMLMKLHGAVHQRPADNEVRLVLV